MKRTNTTASAAFLLWIASLAAFAFADVTAIEPVKIIFSSVSDVFVKDEAPRRAVDQTKVRYLRRSVVLDGIVESAKGRIWCTRAPGGGYNNPFRQNDITIKELKSLQSASGPELIVLLGEPVYRAGPLDTNGTVVWKWGVCNGARGDRFQALEIAAGFKSGATNNSLFLIVASGRTE